VTGDFLSGVISGCVSVTAIPYNDDNFTSLEGFCGNLCTFNDKANTAWVKIAAKR
jgi:hypothetical protein